MQVRLMFIFFSVLLLVAGCSKPSNPLVGKWQMTSKAGCNTIFIPAPSETLEFFRDGTYVGSIFSIPGGTYEVLEGRLKVHGPLNVNAVFGFAISKETFTIQDNDTDCRIEYRLVK